MSDILPDYNRFHVSQLEEAFTRNPPQRTSLQWKPSVFNEAELKKDITLKDFTSLLKNAGILDMRALPLLGSQIWLPYGNRILRQFSSIVRDTYARFAFEEYAYPSIVPMEIFSPMENFHPVHKKLLYIKGHQDSSAEDIQERILLSPTGESSIYWHWKELTQNTPLPIKMFQQTTYYRPKSKKTVGSIFRGFEARNVFEFHCCHAAEGGMSASIGEHINMLRGLYDSLDIPVIWTTRPLWTNNYRVHQGAYAADIFLPFGKTMQLSTIYAQGQTFSKWYDIKALENGEHTFHSTGYCSQRAVLAFIILASHVTGRFFVPSSLSPHPIEVILNWNDDTALNITHYLKDRLPSKIKTKIGLSPKEVSQAIRHSMREGTPLTITIQNKRNDTDKYKVILIRRDKNEEYVMHLDEINGELINIITLAFTEIRNNTSYLCRKYIADKVRIAPQNINFSDIGTGYPSLIPLTATEESVAVIEKYVAGEVIGFLSSNDERDCLVTKLKTRTMALICRRM